MPAFNFAQSSLAQWFAAGGTIAAVIVALFKDSIRAWWREPRLEASCSKEIPTTVRMPIIVQTQDGNVVWRGDCYYVRIKVENTGRTRAENVQISASKLALRGLDEKFVDVPTILPLNLKWSNSPPGRAVTILDGISPKMSAFCDVLSLCDPSNPHQRKPANAAANATVGQLQLEVDLFTEWQLLSAGTYRLTLRIAAANAEPLDKTVEFTHTGTWLENDAEMRRDCIAISLR